MRRRDWIKFAGASGLLPGLLTRPTRAQDSPAFKMDPFSLGMASGYPTIDSVVLWTRLAPQPDLPGGGLDPVPISVHWEVSRDEGFQDVVSSGVAIAEPDWAHSVHVEVRGLESDRWYWYRFRAGDARSRPARTRTAPSVESNRNSMRFAFASCQQYEHGWFGAYRHMVADSPDLVVFLGDYIYEMTWGVFNPRKHGADEPYTLDEYRRRYALYKTDMDLQAAHAACPWVAIWDDHEVDNDYANDLPEDGMPIAKFLERRAAAYQAWYEHQPVPNSMRPQEGSMRIHATTKWGRLANFYLLDCRQYRSHEACPSPFRKGGSNVTSPCADLEDPQRTMLGSAQESWLDGELSATSAHWNIIAQTTLMAQFNRAWGGGGKSIWTDGWDGYPLARRRLLQAVIDHKVSNPVVIGGDVHAHFAADLKVDFDVGASPVVASEFVCTSISAHGLMQQNYLDKLSLSNPHLKYARGDRRGYVRVNIEKSRLIADMRGMTSVRSSDADCETLASFVVEDGRRGPRPL